MSKVENPFIYVACLASYNEGRLHGVWIDATLGVDYIWNEVNAMLKKSCVPHAEEWAIHGYENFYDVNISESMAFEDVVEIAEFLKEYGKLGAEALNYYGRHLEDARTAFEENYHGEFNSKVDFATTLIEDELSALPDHISRYFNYEYFAQDLFINDYLDFEVDGKTHVFSHF